MQEGSKTKREKMPQEQLSTRISDVLSGIRVPDLPYPVGKLEKESISDWAPLLLSCWTEQRDEPVTRVIRSVSLQWSVRQINSAYVADRIMDVFLKSSGLHPELAKRVARLRFFLAWRMNLEGADVFNETLLQWLDSLQEHRGWSNSGGRSSRALLDQLDSLTIEVSSAFDSGDVAPVMAFCRQWREDGERREQQAARLRERLLDTEKGAARQRQAEHTARALVGRALKNRKLPQPIIGFILDTWFKLLKQVVWEEGTDSENWRHASKLLEWLIWIGDPSLSDSDQDRLYTVGEQLEDRLVDVWGRLNDKPLDSQALAGVQSALIARLRGESPDLVSALSPDKFSWNSSWLVRQPLDKSDYDEFEGRWFVEGEGAKEQRRFFFALLNETQEVLWTNGSGVKLGVTYWSEFRKKFDEGAIRALPSQTPFGQVLAETIHALSRVLQRQVELRKQAAAKARQRAEALRAEKQAEEDRRAAEIATQNAKQESERKAAEAKRLADEAAHRQQLLEEQKAAAEKLVAGIKLGGWIVVHQSGDEDARRLKLAVRINASRKLVFVDRLGLNRQEFSETELVADVLSGKIRVLGASAEFEDTLSRVVGRIRVGR